MSNPLQDKLRCSSVTAKGIRCKKTVSKGPAGALSLCTIHLKNKNLEKKKREEKEVKNMNKIKQKSKKERITRRKPCAPRKIESSIKKIAQEPKNEGRKCEERKCEERKCEEMKNEDEKTEEEECPVCLENGNNLFGFSCRHFLCRECLLKMNNYSCPICRKNFRGDVGIPYRRQISARIREQERQRNIEEEENNDLDHMVNLLVVNSLINAVTRNDMDQLQRTMMLVQMIYGDNYDD